MTQELIEATLKKHAADPVFEIRFKVRSPINGLFINTVDFRELSNKNLWRIVSETHIAEFRKTGDAGLARIFNGVEFTRLEPKNEKTK